MSEDSFGWRDIVDGFLSGNSPILHRNIPPMESKDGEEPTIEVLRERARKIDTQRLPEVLKKPSSPMAPDRLDKEFWDLL